MKNTALLKKLIDILYFINIFALIFITLGFTLIFFFLDTDKFNLILEDSSIPNLSLLLLAWPIFIIFLRGLFYLRKVAQFLLLNNSFSDGVTINLKKSGNHFIYAGVGYLAVVFISWLINLFTGHVELSYSENMIIPLFLIIIGLFFLIQSNTLNLAKGFKDENELTV